MATVTLITPTITEGMGIMVIPITIMAIIRTVTMGEVGVFDVQVVEHLTLAQAEKVLTMAGVMAIELVHILDILLVPSNLPD